jgi:hypothetical protein
MVFIEGVRLRIDDNFNAQNFHSWKFKMKMIYMEIYLQDIVKEFKKLFP